MKSTINLWEKGEYQYPRAGEFLPNITTYLHEDDEIRPAMLVVPGGGYAIVSPTEGEIVAKRFFEAGYQAFVLTYTTNVFKLEPLHRQPLEDISRAVRCIRKNAEEWHVQSDRIVCCGFSAGAHLVGSLAVHYKEQEAEQEPWKGISNRPDAVILCYPVITSGEKAHRESFEFLLGQDASEKQLAWASLENHVTADTPPAFLWHTITDELVPVENSILYAKACHKAGVSCELHLFMEGKHGMSLATEDWASGNLGEGSGYTMMQHWQTLKTLHQQNSDMVPEVFMNALKAENIDDFVMEWDKAAAGDQEGQEKHADASAAQWPSLAIAWLDKV